MMMLKKFRCLALVMALILVVVSCTTFAAKKPIKLVYGHIWPPEHYYCKGDLYFKELVEKNSKGQILIDYFPGGQLGNERELLQATKSGAQQLIITSFGVLQQWWPKIITFGLPYIVRDDKHQLKIAEKITTLIDQEELAAKTGVRIIGIRLSSPRQLNTKFPVNKLEDLKGHKIRVPENAMLKALFQAWGAIPTMIPAADLYTALATGTVEGQENPFSDIYTRKTYEQAKYCALTAHTQGFYSQAISDKCWKSLSARQKKIITVAANKTTKMMFDAAKANEEKYYQILVKAGMQFTKPDLTPFKEKAKTIWNRFGDPEWIKKIQAIK
jgi:tripartite ATP-independent transporter DctP family solute receptor